MVSTQTEIESQVIELAGKSFKTFCDDISGMFGTDMECSPQAVGTETLKGLQARFKDLVVVYSVKAEPANPQDALRQGGLNGTFQLVFDQKGLFILAGVVAMHPEQMVLEDAKFGSLEKAKRASGVLKEIGTALTGAWDRVFRKELDGHGRFVQTNIFIGNPWDKSEEKIGLAGDEELVFVPYEMTIGTYPTFKCGVILPKAIFAQEETESRAPNVSEGVEATEPEEGAATAEKAKPADEETVAADKSAAKEEPEAAAEQAPEAAAEEEPEAAAKEEPEAAADQVPEVAAEEKPEAAAEGEPEVAADQEPEAAAEQVPEAAAEQVPEAAAEEEPEAAADQVPEVAAEEKPEAAAEGEPEVAADQEPEAAAEQEPEVAAKQEPEVAADQEPEAAAEQEPEVAAEQVPEAAAKEVPEAAAAEQAPEAAAEQAPEAAAEQVPAATAEQAPEVAAEGEPAVAADQEQPAAATEEEPAATKEEEPEATVEQEPKAAAEQKPNDVEEEATTMAETDKSEEHPVSETIQKMAQSPAALPGEPAPSTMAEKPALSSKDASSTVCAKDIMQKDVIWGNPDDSVQQALTKIQQHDAGYIMIGQGQVPEGVVSKSDLTGALSPYLRSTFAKWRRPLDDATLQIRIKWIMSKPTCTISPETSLAAIMGNMCQAGIRCLPVVDEHGRVQGLVTALDIFKVLLKHSHPK